MAQQLFDSNFMGGKVDGKRTWSAGELNRRVTTIGNLSRKGEEIGYSQTGGDEYKQS